MLPLRKISENIQLAQWYPTSPSISVKYRVRGTQESQIHRGWQAPLETT